MKRVLYTAIAVVLVLASGLPALAGSAECESSYVNGELCSRSCDFYDDEGNYIGSIEEDYNC